MRIVAMIAKPTTKKPTTKKKITKDSQIITEEEMDEAEQRPVTLPF